MDVMIDGKMVLTGIVGGEFFGDDGFSSVDVIRALATLPKGSTLNVHINSPGGYSDEGVAIYNSLAAWDGEVVTYAEGMAASAASIIFMAGDRRVMRPGSLLMVHYPAGFTMGDAADHQKSINSLEATATAMCEIYAGVTGRTAAQCRDDMKAETWMTGDQAVEMGYATESAAAANDDDETMETVAFNYKLFAHAPKRLVAMSNRRKWSLKMPKRIEAQAQEIDVPVPETTMALETPEVLGVQAIERAQTQGTQSMAGEEARAAATLARDIVALCNSEGVSTLATSLIGNVTNLDEARTRITDAKEIKTACAAARRSCASLGASLADEYLAAGTSLKDVQSDLFTRMTAAQAAGAQITAMHQAGGGNGDIPGDSAAIQASWKRSINKVAPSNRRAA